MISIDGNVYTGKTTLALALSRRLGLDCVPELGVPHQRRGASLWSSHYRYLLAEARRFSALSGTSIVVDRSVLSLAAHVSSVFITGLGDIREPFLKWLRRTDLALPDHRIVLRCSSELIHGRIVATKNSRKTSPLFYDSAYLSGIDDYYDRLGRRLSLSVLDASLSQDEVLALALSSESGSSAGLKQLVEEALW